MCRQFARISINENIKGKNRIVNAARQARERVVFHSGSTANVQGCLGFVRLMAIANAK
jgi:hypothetical protein